MPFATTINLTTLRSIQERRERESEPYIWAYLAGIAFGPGTFKTDPNAAILSASRHIIRSGMREGQVAQLDFPGNVVGLMFDDGQFDVSLMLVVTLLEADEDRTVQMQAGFQAYMDELHVQLGHKLLAIIVETDPSAVDLLINEIKAAALARARQAVKDNMSAGQKVADFFGTYDRDDFIDTRFELFRDVDAIRPWERNLTLELVGSGSQSQRRYQLDGRLSVVNIEVDICQARIDAVRAAEQVLRGLYAQRRSLQDMLIDAPPGQKAAIVNAIEALNPKIAEAEAALRRAEDALRRCREGGPVNDPIVRDPGISPVVREDA